jgi:hypothetical protein
MLLFKAGSDPVKMDRIGQHLLTISNGIRCSLTVKIFESLTGVEFCLTIGIWFCLTSSFFAFVTGNDGNL